MVSQNLWTFLLEYSVIQGVILSIWAFVKQRKTLLALFFLQVSYVIFIFLLEHFRWYHSLPHLIWTHVPGLFVFSPLLYLHIRRTFAQRSPRFTFWDSLHFVPALLMFVYISPFYFFQSASYKIAAFEHFYADKNIDYVQIGYLSQIALYVVLGRVLVWKKLTKLNNEDSHSINIHLNIYRGLYQSLTMYVVLGLTLAITLAVTQNNWLSYYYFVYLALAFGIFAATIYLFYHHQSPLQEPHQIQVETISSLTKPTVTMPSGLVKYANSALNLADRKAILHQIETHLTTTQAYKNPQLKLAQLSEQIQVPAHHISQCLNQELGKNFFEFINTYRVEAVKQQLLLGAHQHLTLFAIASNCGFNSQSSFYRIFKKITGETPRSFLEKSTTNH
ncbi:hypothetical protein BKI52_04640 [marine bacterium AO1-C]|nr:hypothetical protein BKI52_04640 [marine bacterium AO1-C]